MRIRHLVAIDNVDDAGHVIDPLLVRHGLVVGSRVAGLAGAIEPLTHLNLDFPAHRLDRCLVVKRLAIDAPIVWDGDHFRTATVRVAAYRHLGPVAAAARRIAWQRAIAGVPDDGAGLR